MLDNACLRCLLCFMLGVAVKTIENYMISWPLTVAGFIVLVPSMRSKIISGG